MTELSNPYKLRTAIIDHVRRHPGATSLSISAAIGHPESNVATALWNIHDKGLLSRQRAGRYYSYFIPAPKPAAKTPVEPVPAEDEPRLVRPNDDVVGPRRQRVEAPEVQDDAKTVEALRAEIERLTQWQADAVAKYPDLRADPLLVEAREIAASLWDDDGDHSIAEAVRKGNYDDDLEVRAALAALKRREAQ